MIAYPVEVAAQLKCGYCFEGNNTNTVADWKEIMSHPAMKWVYIKPGYTVCIRPGIFHSSYCIDYDGIGNWCHSITVGLIRLCSLYDSIITLAYFENHFKTLNTDKQLYKYMSDTPNYQVFNLGFKHIVDFVEAYVKRYRNLYRSHSLLLNRVKYVCQQLDNFFSKSIPPIAKPDGITMADGLRLIKCYDKIISD